MESLLLKSFRWAILPAIVVASMALSRKLLPAKTAKQSKANLGSDKLNHRFMPLRGRMIGGMILIGVAFVFGTWQALTSLNRLLATLAGPADFRLLPQTAIWWFFPAFGALSLCWEITLQIYSRFAGRDTAELFSDWTNQSSQFWGPWSSPGMDSRRVLRWMALLIALPSAFFTCLALPMHASIGPDSIRDCGYAFKPCKVYHLADASRITAIQGFGADEGKLTKRAGLVVDFKDGRRWSSAEWGNFKDTVDPALADFLTRTTNLPIKSAVTEEDIPPLAK